MTKLKVETPYYRLDKALPRILFKYALLMLGVLLLTACASEPKVEFVYVQKPLTRPERPVLPHVKEAELQCLAKDAYQRLYDRQRLLREYAVTLESIIDSTKRKEERF